MKPSKILDIFDFYENTLYIKKSNTLVVSDLHIGLEYELRKKGGFQIPLNEERLITNRLNKIIDRFQPDKIILNGDILHSFSSLNYPVKEEFQSIFRPILRKNRKFIFIKGSHDTMIENLVKQEDLRNDFYVQNNILFTHGNYRIDLPSKIKYIVIGHEHPCVEINMEKIPCFLFKYELIKNTSLIILPAFNPLLEGVLINNQNFTSPLLRKVSPDLFQPIISIGMGEPFIFPRISELKSIEWNL
ncbi:MAG: hypothetical protein GF329_15155 [Candidatus Lokiarchaeota archaeon]|nr:hypothetical protein [Candidatus Lokiarchaeota archaeon]